VDSLADLGGDIAATRAIIDDLPDCDQEVNRNFADRFRATLQALLALQKTIDHAPPGVMQLMTEKMRRHG
jgi:hypothetical protein